MKGEDEGIYADEYNVSDNEEKYSNGVKRNGGNPLFSPKTQKH